MTRVWTWPEAELQHQETSKMDSKLDRCLATWIRKAFIAFVFVLVLGCANANALIFSTVYTFQDQQPTPSAALVQGSDGNLYGTTQYGGTDDSGTIFRMTEDGTVTTLVSFNGDNGANPYAALVQAGDGNFYGTTASGGANGYGTVFKMDTNGTLTTLFSFNLNNGGAPVAGLAQGTDGNFYGVAQIGGTNGNGTAFKITPSGTLTTLISFSTVNGASPSASLVLGSDGNFYGTTESGGAAGDGTVFKISTNGTLTTLVSFNGANGSNPQSALIVGTDGNFYGTTPFGGAHNNGTAFKMTANGTLTTLVSFNGTNGAFPAAAVVQGSEGNFYGTTQTGGVNDDGTVFKVTANGTLTTLVSFDGTNGANPQAPMVQGSDGNYYGTTTAGSTNDNGTVFKIVFCTPISFSPATLPAGTALVAYSTNISASGATAPYTYAVTSGSLPAGLSLTTGGLLSGAPSSSGTNTFTVTATDANGCTGSEVYSITVGCSTITLSADVLPGGISGSAYSQAITASGGAAPYIYTLGGGSLPAGMSLSTNGSISGTCGAAGTYQFTVIAVDTNACSASSNYTINVTCPTITEGPAALPSATVGVGYNPSVTASGGTSSYTFSVSSGSLPTGLSLASSGLISGTPTTSGSYSFTVTATDANGCTGTSNYTVNVSCPTIALSPDMLSAGTFGSAYSQVITATGGTPAYTFAVTAGSLPNGVGLANNGLLSGTPTSSGSFNFTVTATDFYGCVGTAMYSLSVPCPVISVGPASFSDGTTGSSYSATVSASGGRSPYTFAVNSGSLPTGLSLNGTSGGISGTATASGTYHFSIQATDADGCTGSSNYTVNVICPAITVSPMTLTAGIVGSSYSNSITADGGTAPYVFAVTSGSLPGGLNLDSGGLIAGTPTNSGDFSFTVGTTDAHGCTGSSNYTINLTCPTITLSPQLLPAATVGSAYNQLITATGGTSPYTFSVTSGSLPAGMGLASGGLLSGAATNSGSFSFTVTATDAYGCTASSNYTINATCPTVSLSPSTLPGATFNTPYVQLITAAGGTSPYAFAVTGGALPDGLVLSRNGGLAGRPLQSGNFNFTITATDVYGCAGSISYSLSIPCPVISVGPATLPDGTTGSAYNTTVTANGGRFPYTFAVNSGSLPSGLTFNNGVISGTPTNSGTSHFSIEATDADNCTGTSNYTIAVTCPAISLSPMTLTGATVGSAYSNLVTATGGTSSYTFSVTSGSLPSTLNLNSSGLISGTPTNSGVFNFTVTATDAYGCTGSSNYTLNTDCPSIALNPMNLANGFLGTNYSTSPLSASGGTAPYTFGVTSGALPTGVSLASNGSFSGIALELGTYSFTVTATDSHQCIGTANYTIVIQPSGSASDTIIPVVTIVSPRNKTITTSAPMTISGTARDSLGTIRTGVAEVLYSLNDGPPQLAATANKFTNWTANITLQPGWNKLTAQAFDHRGNASVLASNIYFYGNTANVVGQYNGLFYETNSDGSPAIAEQTAGAVFSLSVATSGSFHGTMFLGGASYPLKGLFNLAGDCTTNVSRVNKGKPQLTVAMHVDWTGTSKRITGTVSCASEGWVAPLLADLAVFSKNNPYPTPARYTMVIQPGNNAPANSPGGFGYGLITNNARGTISFTGALADSRRVSQTVPISKDGHWPLYVSPYNKQGLIEGWIDFSAGTPQGQLTWIKPSHPTGITLTTYLNGFTNTVDVNGSVYAPMSPAIPVPSGSLEFTDGSGLNLPITFNAGVSNNNRIVKMTAVTNVLTGSISTSTGLMTVTFQPNGIKRVLRTGTGVVLQNSNAAYGAFIGNDPGTGKITTGAIHLH